MVMQWKAFCKVPWHWYLCNAMDLHCRQTSPINVSATATKFAVNTGRMMLSFLPEGWAVDLKRVLSRGA